MRTIKVLIADPHPMSRRLLAEAVQGLWAFQLCAITADPADLPELCRHHQPELVVTDPGLELGLLHRLKQENPWLKIAVLTSVRCWELPQLLQALGVEGLRYRQTEETTPLSTFLERVCAGQQVYPEAPLPVQIGLAQGEDFTPREKDVLRHLLDGASDKSIAAGLGISPHAVHYHINNMLSKTGFGSRIRLAVMVQRSGFVMCAEKYQVMKQCFVDFPQNRT